MGGFQQCADSAIDEFAKKLGYPYYPSWGDLVPGDDQKGWGADPTNWRKQAKGIIAAFEACAQRSIGYVQNEIDSLRTMTLADFSDYLVEKAEHASAMLAVQVAIANLRETRVRHLKSGIRAKTPGLRGFSVARFVVK